MKAIPNKDGVRICGLQLSGDEFRRVQALAVRDKSMAGSVEAVIRRFCRAIPMPSDIQVAVPNPKTKLDRDL